MPTFERITIKKNERALLLRNGDFERVLHSGSHWLIAASDELKIERFALNQPAFQHELADYLMSQEPAVVAAEFVAVQLSEHEVALRSENGVLVEILPPATRALYWKGLVETTIETINESHRYPWRLNL
ncbi:slipin family protein, partial [Lampropedia puyangensis]